jgi:chorismate mutase/prephenate dehydratase
MRPILFCVVALGLFAQDQSELAGALSSSRQRIDHIDDQIVKLLNERAEVVREVGLVKARFHAPASAPGREDQVLHRVSTQARAPLTPDAIRKIYLTVLAEMSVMEDREMHADQEGGGKQQHHRP